jgi:formylmethanofuran--tetrahydromethanopterin N-formyltransferase
VLTACERAVKAIGDVPDAIAPFPGGIVRSGSKVGSKYKGQIASTNDAYCPTLKAAVNTALPLNVEAVMEIVIDGLSASAVAAVMRAGIYAAVKGGAGEGITSPPATTAAIWGRIISTSRRSSRECLDARASQRAEPAA